MVLAAVLATLTATALSSPALATGHPPKRQAVMMLHKQLAVPQRVAALGQASRQGSASAQESGEDEDEAGSLLARTDYEQSIVSAPAAVAPAAGLLAAGRAAAALPTKGARWDEVTDKPFLNDPVGRGQNYGVGWGVVTGRMTSLTARGGTVWAGSASGGVWRTTDRGATWRTDDKGLPRLSVGALATSPRNRSVWVGTGEPNNSSEGQYGVGVYQQRSGSRTWRRVGGHEIDGAGVHRISWIGSYVYAATTHGLFRRASEAGRTTAWKPVLQPGGAAVYPPTSDVTDVIAVPGTHGHQVLAVVGWAGLSRPQAVERNGFYVGTGAAGSFARVGLTGDIDAKTIGRTTLSSSGGWLYAVVMDTSTGTLLGQGVYVSRSGDPAGPWSRIADVDKLAGSGSALGDASSGYYPGVQAWYNQNIVADPKDRRHLYLQLEEVFESTDGGASWVAVGPYWNYDISCEQANGDPYACPSTTHPDQHAGFIDHGQFWAGNDGGVWRRSTGQHARGHWTNLNAGLHTLQNYSVAAGAIGDQTAYWGGLQDNGESYARTNLNRVEQAFTGDGGDTLVDPRAGDRAVVEYTNLDMYSTVDGGQHETEISPSCLTATDPPARCDPNPRFIAPIEMDVSNPDHWVAGGQYVWDDTASWDTVCSSKACDWKPVYDTGAG
ncbi:MAG: WD40/YVTN/BNR-like repeat-containing protein, partial [Janthinobacterium lividum]